MDLNEREPLPITSRPINEAFKFNSKDFPLSSNLINFSLYPPTPKSLSLSHTHTHTHTHNSLLVFSLLLGFHVTYTLPIIKLRENRGILGQEEQNFPNSFS